MQIERGHHPSFRTDHGSHCAEQIAFQIAGAFRRGGAVQRQQHGIDGHRRAQILEQLRLQPAIAIGRERSARTGAGDHERHDFGAALPQRRQHTADGSVADTKNLGAAAMLLPLERSQFGRLSGELIALREQRPDGDFESTAHDSSR